MRKTELVDAVASNANLSPRQADDVVSCLFEQITNALARGESIGLVGFGAFSLTQRAARTGINPQTGERIQIPAKKHVGFKPGRKLKEFVDTP